MLNLDFACRGGEQPLQIRNQFIMRHWWFENQTASSNSVLLLKLGCAHTDPDGVAFCEKSKD